MASNEIVEILAAFMKQSNKNSYCLFLGAGASFTSGYVSFPVLKSKTIGKYVKSENPEDLAKAFEQLFEEFDNEANRVKLVKECLRKNGSHSNEELNGHDYLFAICEAGYINNIITTNFDLLIESSFEKFGEADDIVVITPDSKKPDNLYALANERTVLLKIHGDVNCGIYNITQEELTNKKYSQQIQSATAKMISKSSGIIFCGYGGQEQVFADLLEQIIKAENIVPKERFVWISPQKASEDAPLRIALQDNLLESGTKLSWDESLTFDKAMRRLYLSLGVAESSGYFDISDLTANQKVKLGNSFHLSKFDNDLFFTRENLKKEFDSAISSSGFVQLMAPSGCGKSTFIFDIVRQFTYRSVDYIPILITSERSGDVKDIKSFLFGEIFNTGSYKDSLVYWDILDSKLKYENRQLYVIFDGINEFCNNMSECAELYRKLIEFHAWLGKYNIHSIKIIISIRTDSFKYIKLEYSEYIQFQSKNHALVEFSSFEEHELEAVYDLYKLKFQIKTDFHSIREAVRKYLYDPKLLEILCEAHEDTKLPASIHLNDLMEQYLEAKTKRSDELNILREMLYEIAFQSSHNNKYKSGVTAQELGAYAKHLGSLVNTDILRIHNDKSHRLNLYRWSHDKLFEYCLAMYHFEKRFKERDWLSGELQAKPDDLSRWIARGHEHSYMYNSAKFVMLQLYRHDMNFCKRFILKFYQEHKSFINETIWDISLYSKNDLKSLFLQVLSKNSSEELQVEESLHKSLIIGLQNNEDNTSLLWDAYRYYMDIEKVELAIDSMFFVLKIIASKISKGDTRLSSTLKLLNYSKANSSLRAGTILYLTSITPAEGRPQQHLINQLIGLCGKNIARFNRQDIERFKDIIGETCNKFLFNSNEQDIEQFFNRTKERKALYDEYVTFMESDCPRLNLQQLETICSFLNYNNNKIEKILLQPAFIVSAINNFDVYKQNMLKLLENSTRPREADFCTGNLAFQFLARGTYEKEISYKANKYCADHKEILLDHIYYKREEDYNRLFNPIGTYSFCYPAADDHIDLFYELLNENLKDQEKNVEVLLRILHAMRQATFLKPDIALRTLSLAFANTKELKEPIRERLSKVLSDSYAIFPGKVKSFLLENAGLFTREQVQEICFEQDANIFSHALTILEWARLYRSILSQKQGHVFLIKLVKIINHSDSIDQLIEKLKVLIIDYN